MRDILWNVEAFQRLLLPHDYKEIIRAFVHSQLSQEQEFDDVISGKGIHTIPLTQNGDTDQCLQGQGIILLLSGEPGTGKTLTAESGT